MCQRIKHTTQNRLLFLVCRAVRSIAPVLNRCSFDMPTRGSACPTELLFLTPFPLAYSADWPQRPRRVAATATTQTDYGRSEYHNMFVTCEERVVCAGCCSGVTGSHEFLGYFDFAALLRGESTDRGVGNLRGARTQLLLLQLLCLRQSCLHWYT